MNQPAAISDSQLSEWAARQLADYDARTPGSIFGEGVELSVAQGYALQAAVARLRCDRGEKIIGYKVGCTSPTIRRQLGIDHCVTGRLYDSERHASGAELSCQAFANLAIEGELAVELGREPSENDFDDADKIPACVARVFPVIELHHHVLRGERPSAGELIAHNAINGGFIEGAGVRPEDFAGEASLAIFADDQLFERCEGPVLLQTIHSSLKWLASIVQERGDRLCAGQIIRFRHVLFPAFLTSAFALFAIPVTGQPPVQVRPSKENIVASELLGTWIVDDELSSRIGGQSDHLGKGPITFREDGEAVVRMLEFMNQTYDRLLDRKRDEKTQGFLDSLRTVYLAGEVEFKQKKWDFALISIYGTPRLFFYDRDGDGESENVMLARDEDGDNDPLFLGGDFNNQSFGAFKRVTD